MSTWRFTQPIPRLVLDSALVACLLLAFAYWWLGNGVHEALGTCFLVLVLRHVGNNLFWWKGLRGNRLSLQRLANLLIGIALAVAVGALLVSSVAISYKLAEILPMPRIFLFQEVHWFAAYWTLALAGLHLGINWNRIAALVRNLTGATGIPVWFSILGWAAMLALAIQGLESGSVVGLWPRLAFQHSLSMWDFNEAVLPFFLHWAATVGTLAMAAHLGIVAAASVKRVLLR